MQLILPLVSNYNQYNNCCLVVQLQMSLERIAARLARGTLALWCILLDPSNPSEKASVLTIYTDVDWLSSRRLTRVVAN